MDKVTIYRGLLIGANTFSLGIGYSLLKIILQEKHSEVKQSIGRDPVFHVFWFCFLKSDLVFSACPLGTLI